MNVVWLKRDVRFVDHEPLALAAADKLPCVVLYIYEPELLASDTYHESHHKFINEGLAELDAKLQAVAVGGMGGLTVRTGNALDVLKTLHSSLHIRTLFSHREVGNGISLQRNDRIAAWTAATGVRWTQCIQDGVSCQRHEELDEGSWASKWTQHMLRPQQPTVTSLLFVDPFRLGILPLSSLPDAASCGVTHLGLRPSAQTGGETAAHNILRSFLERRGEGYCDELSSPLTGWDSCSRLSPYETKSSCLKCCDIAHRYLSWGHISLRTVFQSLSSRQEELRGIKKLGRETGRWLKSLSALGSRLRWRSHFAQKLSDQPSIEHDNMCRSYDILRTELDTAKLDAWANGRTGYPMVDACMRSLDHSGWLNFRMRAMLVSFACYDLWLDWRPLAPILARRFLDYEPGIHYPQLQMQAGTTGMNANRIYSATKQAEDHAGPDYVFIRRWVPELSRVPARYMSEPHTMPLEVQHKSGCIIGTDYPLPIVDRAASYLHARSEFAKVKGQAKTKQESAKVFERHGSRKRAAGGQAATKTSAAKKQAASLIAAAAAHPCISSIFAPVVQDEANSVTATAAGRLPKRSGTSAPVEARNPSIKSYFAQTSEKDAVVATNVAVGSTVAALAAAKRTRSGASGAIKNFFGAAVSKRSEADRSSRDVIIIDD